MRTNFPPSYALTRQYEGGNVDDKADRGGRTSRGVTQATYDVYRKSKGLAKRDVFTMTETEAQEVYLSGYWIPTECDMLAVGVDFAAWDYSVNSGTRRGRAAGAKTLKMTPGAAVSAICAERTSFVNAIKNFSKFRKGVLGRVARVEAEGLKMVGRAAGQPETYVASSMRLEALAAEKKSKSAGVKATAATSTATPATIAAPAAAVGQHTSMTVLVVLGLIAVIAAVVGAYFAYHATRHKARADAFGTA